MKKCFFFILTVATVFLSLPGVVQAATCTSKLSSLHPLNPWNANDSWDCTNYPTAADDVILSNAAPIIVNGAEAAASIQWETLTGSRSLTIGSGKSLTVSGAVNLNGTATYSVSFLDTGTFSPATTVYYCSSSTVTGVTCNAGGPPAPEINLLQGASIPSGGSINFGSVAVGSNSGAIPYGIQNTGSANLTLSGSPKIAISGADAGNFTVNETLTASPVAASGSTTFMVTFTPSSAVAKTATLSIANNDSDENPYTVTLNGTGTGPGYGSSPVPGSTINVGSALVGSTVSTVLTVSETGTAALVVNGYGRSGIYGHDFDVTTVLPLNIADGGAPQNLTIECTPSVVGLETTTLTINHNASVFPASYTLHCTGIGAVTAGVTLTSLSSITGSTVLATGIATGAGIGERGFYWWIPPTTATHFGGSESGLIPEGYGAGSFSLTLTGLKPGNGYHVKAYVKVGGQIITSDEQLFTTATTGATGKAAPTVLTDTANYTVSGNSITVSGEITDVGSTPVNVYGFIYAPHSAPFTGDDMLKTGDRAYAMWDRTPLYQGMKFTGTIKNIPPGKWYLRAYAHNVNQDSSADQPESLGYGEDISFTIPCTPETCIPGDVNGNGKVDLDDAMLVLRILAGIPVGYVNLNADVNGDGKIGLEELGYILQKVAELRPSGT